MPEIVTLLLSLLGVIALIVFMYMGSRWLNKRVSSSTLRTMKVIERLSITGDKSLVIVKVGKKNLLIGVSPQRIEKLTELEDEDLELPPTENTDSIGGSFMSNLKQAAKNHEFVKPFLPQKKQGDIKNDDNI